MEKFIKSSIKRETSSSLEMAEREKTRPTVKLSNGIEMPILGYGVFQVSPQAYANEEGVGATTATASVSSPKR
jgi:hypothetical protein